MPDLSTQQLKELFDQYGADLFALCRDAEGVFF